MADKLKCTFCGHVASTKSNLNYHQKKALYCLDIQYGGKKSKKELLETADTFTCEYCSKVFASKHNFDIHVKVCIIKPATTGLINKYNELKEECALREDKYKLQDEEIIRAQERDRNAKETIAKLEAQLAEAMKTQKEVTLTAVSKPTSVRNVKNTSVKNVAKNMQINTLTPIIDSELQRYIPQLSHAHIKNGAKGYAEYALEYPLKDKIVVTDVARNNVAWKDAEGNIIQDLEGAKISEKFFKLILDWNVKSIKQIMYELIELQGECEKKGDDVEHDFYGGIICELASMRSDVYAASAGRESKLKDAFIKQLCMSLVAKPVPCISKTTK